MKRTALLLSLLLSLSALSCAAPAANDNDTPCDIPDALSAADDPGTLPEEEVHTFSEGNNVVSHDPAGYCGNTITTVRRMDGREVQWEKSFWGDESVELTDLLLYLDYSGGICRCLPEYEIITEFGHDIPYGVSLSGAYARYDGRQVALTEEQVAQIQQIIEDISAEDFEDMGLADRS